MVYLVQQTEFIKEDNEKSDITLQYKNPLREEEHPELIAGFPYKFIRQ